jgi:hypothetical protein
VLTLSRRVDQGSADSTSPSRRALSFLIGQVPSSDHGQIESQQLNTYNCNGCVSLHTCLPSGTCIQRTRDTSFQPSEYTLGSELYGTSGGSAPTTTFQYEGIYNSNDTLIWQTAQPGTFSSGPEQDSIVSKPASGNHGGVFHFWCGC